MIASAQAVLASMLLLAADSEPSIDVSDHHDLVTALMLGAIALVGAFFLLRPELWRRLWFARIDARPAALMRITMSAVVLWTFLDLIPLGTFLFGDEGLWLTDMARKNYGGKLRYLWDPEHGFEHVWDPFVAMWGRFSILHLRSDPVFLWSVYALMLVSLCLLMAGWQTRMTSVLAWFFTDQVYGYSPIFYTGGDTVIRVFMFVGMFIRWGEAYSIDSWLRRKRAILAGSSEVPPLRRIPAWPIVLMMLQLALIYAATGLLKSGGTWRVGSALYFALNLDHFYRLPSTGVVTVLHYAGVLPAMTILVHWWEVVFPIALVGMATRAYERERAAGTWDVVPSWRRYASWMCFVGMWAVVCYVAGVGALYYYDAKIGPWPVSKEHARIIVTAIAAAIPLVAVPTYVMLRKHVPKLFRFVLEWPLGKRFWLIVGLGMHIGIDLSMNVGTFSQAMMAPYWVWLSGGEVDAMWRFAFSRPIPPGEGGRPVRKKAWQRALLGTWERLTHRKPGPKTTVLHHPSSASVRRAALLRCWDLGTRLGFAADTSVQAEHLCVIDGNTSRRMNGREAAASLLPLIPGLWWLLPVRAIGLRTLAGTLAMRILAQRG